MNGIIYSYVSNNPVNYIDPEGESIAVVAAVVSVAVTAGITYIVVKCMDDCAKKNPCNDPSDPNRGSNMQKCLDRCIPCIPFLKFLGYTPKGILKKGAQGVGKKVGEGASN